MGPCTLPQTEHPGQGRGLGLPPSPQTDSLLNLPPSYPRIGREATILVQLLLFAILGMAAAFVPGFELYTVLRFAVATAVVGYNFSSVTLRGYLGPVPSAAERGLGVWVATFPRCRWGPLNSPHLM